MCPGCGAGTVRGTSRQQFAVLVLDGAFRMPVVAPVVQALAADRDARLGIGLASTMGFDDTSKALKVATQPNLPDKYRICQLLVAQQS